MFRFTIRDMLWLTALLALGVAWTLDRWQLAAYVGQLRDEVDYRERTLDIYCPQWKNNGQGLR